MKNFKNFSELCNFVDSYSWSEIYSHPGLGCRIGLAIKDLIQRDQDVITHDGIYHTDDVMSTALIRYILDGQFVYSRTRDPRYLNLVFTYDVGGKSFDHHKGDDRRIDNDPESGLSSVGKLWLTLGRTVGLSESEWKKIDNQVVKPIDLTDNTGQMNPFNWIINSTRPAWDCDQGEVDDAFMKAVELGVQIWTSLINSAKASDRATSIFKEAVATAENGVAILFHWCPLDLVYARSKGVHLIGYLDNSNPEQVDIRTCSLPEDQDWIIPESIESMEGVNFRHKGGFICGVDSAFVDSVISEIRRYNCAKL